ncbi:MAG: ribonuclease HI [Candidatus Lightella neohaematopini]|nr:ribonuclease HI [Candidatus Lightella neohaematopini]MCV2529060.1 ribonuclease HI [Candidatus Lightella neohaematopini]
MQEYIYIFTDGACINNPGKGGYGVIIKLKYKSIILGGGYRLTTNNRMELISIIKSLQSVLHLNSNIIVYTDSVYVQQGITKWIYVWKKNNWFNSKNKIIKNLDLWKRLFFLQCNRPIKWIWIKGHSICKENNYCDKLAYYMANYKSYLVDINYENENNIIC